MHERGIGAGNLNFASRGGDCVDSRRMHDQAIARAAAERASGFELITSRN
jgi:hypothetical protein